MTETTLKSTLEDIYTKNGMHNSINKLEHEICEENTDKMKNRANETLKKLNDAVETMKNGDLMEFLHKKDYSLSSDDEYKCIHRFYFIPYGILLDKLTDTNNICSKETKISLLKLIDNNEEYFNKHSKNELCYVVDWRGIKVSKRSSISKILRRKPDIFQLMLEQTEIPEDTFGIRFTGITLKDIENKIIYEDYDFIYKNINIFGHKLRFDTEKFSYCNDYRKVLKSETYTWE